MTRVLLALTLASLSFTACHQGGGRQPLLATFHQIVPLNPGGTFSLRNDEGSIYVYSAVGPGVTIQATKRAYTAERLRAIEIRISSRPNALALETVFPPKRNPAFHDVSGVVDYSIIVPQNTRIVQLAVVDGEISVNGLRDGGSAAAMVRNGRIGARNCFADLDFRARNGNIDFFYGWWEPASFRVAATIRNGGIGVVAPNDAALKVQARTASGGIMGNRLPRQSIRAEGKAKVLETTLGHEARARFVLQSSRGNIKVDGY